MPPQHHLPHCRCSVDEVKVAHVSTAAWRSNHGWLLTIADLAAWCRFTTLWLPVPGRRPGGALLAACFIHVRPLLTATSPVMVSSPSDPFKHEDSVTGGFRCEIRKSHFIRYSDLKVSQSNSVLQMCWHIHKITLMHKNKKVCDLACDADEQTCLRTRTHTAVSLLKSRIYCRGISWMDLINWVSPTPVTSRCTCEAVIKGKHNDFQREVKTLSDFAAGIYLLLTNRRFYNTGLSSGSMQRALTACSRRPSAHLRSDWTRFGANTSAPGRGGKALKDTRTTPRAVWQTRGSEAALGLSTDLRAGRTGRQ